MWISLSWVWSQFIQTWGNFKWARLEGPNNCIFQVWTLWIGKFSLFVMSSFYFEIVQFRRHPFEFFELFTLNMHGSCSITEIYSYLDLLVSLMTDHFWPDPLGFSFNIGYKNKKKEGIETYSILITLVLML